MKRVITALLLLLLLTLSALPAWGEAPLKFGVLAFRPKPQTMEQWQPLAAYLTAQLGRPVELSAYDYQGLNAAVERNMVDIVLTNSGHFILLQQRYNLSAPLVTKITKEGGHKLTGYGGAIFTKADQVRINTLADLSGKRVGATSKDSLAGYQIQAFELLEAGARLPEGDNLLLTDNPHDRVVEAVLAGQADAGFVRTGVLESMAGEGKLDLDRIKIINRQNLPSFPYASSTRIYPEWPLGVTPRVDEQLARHLAVALLSIEPESDCARAAEIHGFTIPADYNGVEDLLHRLRLPPFDTPPDITLGDIWKRYFVKLISMGVLLVLIAAMTVRLAVQKRLVQQSQQRFSTLFESSPDPIWILANRKIVDCNLAAVAIIGHREKTSLLKCHPADFSPERQPDGENSRVKADRLFDAAAGGQMQRFEWLHLKQDGGKFFVAISLTPITLHGQVMVLAVGHDITERKRTEQALAESEERFRTVADFTLSWEYWMGPEDEMLYMSPSCEFVTGYTRAELSADPGLIATIIHPEDRELFVAHRHESSNREDGSLGFRIVRRDGEIRWIEHVCRPVRDQAGHYKGRRVSNRDTTERMRAEEDKAQLESQCQQLQKAESLGRMAGAIAHHFNNMLAAVMGNLELAMDELPKDTNPFACLSQAMMAAHRAAEVSGLMLTYLGQVPVTHDPLDFSAACRQGLPMLRAAIPKGVEVEVDFPSPGPTIEANEPHIQQILTNLTINAWEALADGKGAIHLAVKTVDLTEIPTKHRFPLNWQPQEKFYACLQVTDSGCGIAETNIDQVFDPFFTTKFTGRGLGLAVVMGLTRVHRGAVTVESKLGYGSVFRVFLPISGKPLPPSEEAAPNQEIEWSGTVLLVDDDPTVRDMAKAMLTYLGFSVLEATDGMEGVEVFRQHQDRIRCVISDLTMPRLDGWETLTALRQLAPGIPVILSSGYDKAQVLTGDHPELPQAFLGKPYHLAGMREAIRQALN